MFDDNGTESGPTRPAARSAVAMRQPMHDLSNVVGSILLSAQSLLMEPGLDPEVRQDLTDILEHAQRGKSVLESMRRISKRSLTPFS